MGFLNRLNSFNVLRRAAAPATAVRSFDGASGGRRGWGRGTFGRINSEVAGAGPRLRSSASYLAMNTPRISQAVANWAGALVGSGIVPTPKHADAATRKALSDLWNRFVEEADADWRTDFPGMLVDIVRSLCRVGLPTGKPRYPLVRRSSLKPILEDAGQGEWDWSHWRGLSHPDQIGGRVRTDRNT